MARILVVYWCRYELRASQRDNLLAFGKFPGHSWFYFNAAFRRVPDYLLRIKWDLVIFHWLFMATRGVSEADRQYFCKLTEKVRPLAQLDAAKAIMPQDEFMRMDLVHDFIKDFGISHVFSVAAPELWPILYAKTDFARVHFTRVLTGYLDPDVVAEVADRALEHAARTADIGYRTGTIATWGRLNLLKQELADRMTAACEGRRFVLDVRCGWQHFLLGDAWYEFLLRCRWILGVEGGASILDWDGSLWARMHAYSKENPHAAYEEIEANCFPGRDGEIDLRALSPRHLEACATRTGQALIEGDYNGILRAGEHYVAIRRDFSNVDEVLDRLEDEQERLRLTDAAYEDIVRSGRYTYPELVRTVLGAAMDEAANLDAAPLDASERLAWERNQADELTSWQKVQWYLRARAARDWLRARFAGAR